LTDRVRIVDPSTPVLHGLTGRVVEQVRATVRVKLDRMPIECSSPFVWLGAHQVEWLHGAGR
jgi:hypothetical protein